MDAFSIISTVVVAHFLALISPGPDFLLLVRSSLTNDPKRLVGMALGIALANAIYIALCILGVAVIIAKSYYLMMGLKLIGGLFLLYIAYHALKAKKRDYQALIQEQRSILNQNDHSNKKPRSFFKEFLLGLFSGLSNPKNMLFYLTLFSVVLTPSISVKLATGLGMWMTLLVFLWDTMIIFILAEQRVRKVFAKLAFYIDKTAGVLLGLMGAKLLQSAIKNQT